MDEVDVFFWRRLPWEALLPVVDARIKRGGISLPRNLSASRRGGKLDSALWENREDGRMQSSRGEVPGLGCLRPEAGLPNVSGRETL